VHALQSRHVRDWCRVYMQGWRPDVFFAFLFSSNEFDLPILIKRGSGILLLPESFLLTQFMAYTPSRQHLPFRPVGGKSMEL